MDQPSWDSLQQEREAGCTGAVVAWVEEESPEWPESRWTPFRVVVMVVLLRGWQLKWSRYGRQPKTKGRSVSIKVGGKR